MNGVYFGGGGPKKNPRVFAYIAKLKRMGWKPGDPDLRLHWSSPEGPKTLYIELKAGKNKPSPDQLEFKEYCQQIGIPWVCCWTLDEYIQALAYHNVPTRKI